VKFEATIPRSTHEYNKRLDRDIVDRESDYDAAMLDAPWAYRVYATIASSLKKWIGW
jgi:hypothetical protein